MRIRRQAPQEVACGELMWCWTQAGIPLMGRRPQLAAPENYPESSCNRTINQTSAPKSIMDLLPGPNAITRAALSAAARSHSRPAQRRVRAEARQGGLHGAAVARPVRAQLRLLGAQPLARPAQAARLALQEQLVVAQRLAQVAQPPLALVGD